MKYVTTIRSETDIENIILYKYIEHGQQKRANYKSEITLEGDHDLF